jgi:hypothetical protein
MPFSAVPFHRRPKTPGEGKTDTVVGQAVIQHKKLRPTTTTTLSFSKNLPDCISSL